MSAQDRKIVIVGAGSVGASTAYTLVNSGLVDELVLIDVNRERAEGEVSDLNHGQVFVPPVKIKAGGYDECRDAAIIIVTAGAAQKPGETRLDLTRRNAGIIKGIVEEMNRYLSDQVIIMVTNPVDILTMVAHRVCSLPPHNIIGSGTALDSARFSFFLARHCGIDTRDVRAYVIGEHGDSEVPLWSRVDIAGISFDDYCHICNRDGSDELKEEISRKVRESAYHVIESKGATNWAVSLSLLKVAGAILRYENSILSVSTRCAGFYGLPDTCLSLPVILDREGVKQVIAGPISPHEQEQLSASGRILRQVYEDLRL